MWVLAVFSKLKIYRKTYFVLRILGLVSVLFILSLWIVPVPQEKLHPAQAYRFFDRNEQLLNVIISADGFFRMHVPYDEISPLFINTLLAYEDKHYFKHPGINPFAIGRALTNNLKSGKITSGGSTISMQLARMLNRRERSYGAKILEIYRAFQLEARLNKKQILAHYLAIAPYGGNIEGIEAAAYYYFNKSAKHLSIGETALLVSIPKSPNLYRPDRQPKAAQVQRNKILKLMLAEHLITQEQYNRAITESVVVQRTPTINLAPHFAWRHKSKNPNTYVVKTTLDENLQRKAQQLLQNYVARINQHNISNGALVIIDNATREVRAAVGSTDYFSRQRLGYNDGVFAARSPGSTLKPFLYGLALQQGAVGENTMLEDVPMEFSGYQPENFYKRYSGPVTLHNALTESLNVVAVELTRKVGLSKLHGLLKQGGLTTLTKEPDHYGLPLVLGGVEVRLVELTNLYASLANEGWYQPYKIIQNPIVNSTNEKRRLLNAESNWLLSKILTDVERPDFPASWQFSKNRPTIAWKTGTSYGNRDAWSVGYTPHYTIGVWLGNFDGTASVGLIGSQIAGPILFDLFQAVEPVTVTQWFSKPDKVKSREVCTLSGKLPGRYCPRTKTEYYVGASIRVNNAQDEVCPIHQRVHVKSDAKNNAEEKIVEIWSPRMARHLHLHGVPVNNVPPYDLEKLPGDKYYKPEIISPLRNETYVLRPDQFKPEEHGIKLSAAVTNRIKKVYWFIDGKLHAEGDPYADHIINPKPGTYKITLMDDIGGTDSVTLNVVIPDPQKFVQKKNH